jgi:hypothetical protein
MTRVSIRSRAAGRLGYPGLVLLVFGWFWFLIGVGVYVRPDYSPQLIHTHLPVWIRVTLWLVCGVGGMILAWSRRLHPVGFGLLVLPPAERSFSYSFAFFHGPSLVWLVAASVWCSMTFAVLLFASWPEPPERKNAP